MGARNLVPLIILLVLVAVLGVVGYVVYTIVQNVSKNTRANMERKHLMFTKDGMKVEVKELCDEEYKDRSQRYDKQCIYYVLCYVRCFNDAIFVFF